MSVREAGARRQKPGQTLQITSEKSETVSSKHTLGGPRFRPQKLVKRAL